MNILVLSWRDPKHPLAGGAEQVMHEHMKGWIEAGHKVIFFSSRPPNTKNEEIIDEVKIIRRGSQYITTHVHAFFWYTFGKHEKFDLVVDQFHGWPFFTPLYIREQKLAVIQELTRQVWFRYPLPLGLNLVLGTIGYIIEPLFFLFYRNVSFMTGSESAKLELQSFGIKKQNITVVPHGVIINTPKNAKKEKVKTVMFLGALAKDKGIEDAIKTFAILSKTGNYQFWVVGKGDETYLKHLQNLVKKLQIIKQITFFGFVSQQVKFKLLSCAHLVINPSIREGWGLVNIEANAMSTPVVAYNSQGLVDSVKDGQSGLIVKNNTPEELAITTANLLADQKLYEKLQIGAKKWARNFSWESSKKQSLALIDEISNSHAHII